MDTLTDTQCRYTIAEFIVNADPYLGNEILILLLINISLVLLYSRKQMTVILLYITQFQ